MAAMASAMSAFTSFVEEIGRIGDSIVQAATNAQVKAGKAGPKGVVLATLAAEIMSVFVHTSRDTDVITITLNEIDTVTTEIINQMSAGMELHPSRRVLAGWGSAPVTTASLGRMWRSVNSNIT